MTRDEAERTVTSLFRGILHRDPDPASLRAFADAFLGGRSPADILDEFVGGQEFRNLTAVKLFVPPGHFYSPVVDQREADLHLRRLEAAPIPASLPGIALDRDAMVATWNALLPFMVSIPFSAHKDPAWRYAFENENYSWGDGTMLHAMLRWRRPRRLVEVGCGWSSACTLDTVERYLGNACDITFIEPFPALLRNTLGDAATRVRIIETPVQQVPLELFTSLGPGDILFIDSTHVLRTGSDVWFELSEILPRLAPGVLVHLHDMFWPFEYPRPWAVDENRSWNELYAVRAFLCGNSGFRILMFNDYLARFETELLTRTCPAFMRNPGGALWLERR